jgi:hypothetical protein
MATYNDPQESYFMGQGGQGGQGGQRGPAIRDGKRMRKAIQRKTVDFSCPTVEYFEVTQPVPFYSSFNKSSFQITPPSRIL